MVSGLLLLTTRRKLRVLRNKRLGLGSAARLLQEAHQPPPRRRAGASGGVG